MAIDAVEKTRGQAEAATPQERLSFGELRKRYAAVRNHVRRALFGVTDPEQKKLKRNAAFIAADSLKQETDPIIEEYKKDPLTGLNTLRTFEEILKVEARIAREKKGNLKLIFTDLDGFKSVNDMFGHESGNEVLAQIGKVIGASIRPTDIAGRYGGDEFVLLLPDTTDEGAKLVIERIVEGIRKIPFSKRLSNRGLKLGMSAGIKDVDLINPQATLKQADREMYEQKKERKKAING